MKVEVGDFVIVKNLSTNSLEQYKIMPVFLKCEITKFNLYKESEYSLLEFSDADIDKNEISANTAFAKEVLNKQIGDIFIVNEISYEIQNINKHNDIFHNSYTALLDEDIIKEEDKDKLLDKTRELIKFLKVISNNNKFYFYHQTNFSNLKSILKEGAIYSRNKCVKKKIKFDDHAKTVVINHTKNSILNYVRFYFRPKNTTHYLSEGITKKNKPCFIVYDNSTIFNGNYNIIMTNKNAACKDFEYNSIYNENGINAIMKYDWNKIYNLNFDYNNIEEKQASCAELLIYDEVNTSDISKIIFRTKGDLNLFKYLYPDYEGKLEYNPNLFYNDARHYVTSNFEVIPKNNFSILKIEYLDNNIKGKHKLKIFLKNNTKKEITNIKIENGEAIVLINSHIDDIKKIEYSIDNISVESWG